MRSSDCTAPALPMSGSDTRKVNSARCRRSFRTSTPGAGVRSTSGCSSAHLLQDGDHLLGIGVVGDADLDADRAERVAVRPVDHAAGDQLRVGNDQAGAVEGLDLGGAHADAAHVALLVADDDPVADLDRPLDQQDQARRRNC